MSPAGSCCSGGPGDGGAGGIAAVSAVAVLDAIRGFRTLTSAAMSMIGGAKGEDIVLGFGAGRGELVNCPDTLHVDMQ